MTLTASIIEEATGGRPHLPATPAATLPDVPRPRDPAGNAVNTVNTVLLAVPDPGRRQSLAEQLRESAPCTFLPASSLLEASRLAAQHGPGELAVVDVELPDGQEPGAAARLVRDLSHSGWRHVVALGRDSRIDTRIDDVRTVLGAGARAFLFAGPGPSEHAPQPTARATPSARRRVPIIDAEGRQRELSSREVDVVRLAADGQSNPEIGRELGLSALTIKSHLRRITERLVARDRAHVVLLALRSGTIH
jgi:DNA-binding NarL/FixJ family response regulator